MRVENVPVIGEAKQNNKDLKNPYLVTHVVFSSSLLAIRTWQYLDRK